ncbi:RNA 2'-phosphotransferase [Paenibacillaceae bacterium]|nr:RNA 2'-phosphotransferase [Paenibacillaceae bacterium]
MSTNRNDTALGRFISLILRHQPDAAGISLDGNGWADVAELLAGMSRSGKSIDMATLERIVSSDTKQRYSFNADYTKIRANQGHSISVDVELTQCTPPNPLYHGTASRFLDSIRVEGITKQSRQYVHLTEDMQTARNVGSRYGSPVLLSIDTTAMLRDGHIFYLSANNVWNCSEVPWQYIAIV